MPLAGKTLELLKAQRQIVPKDCEWVFPGPDGERIVYDRACDNFQSACKKLKIGFTKEGEPDGQFTDADGEPPRPGFHDLRRTFARMMSRAGVPLHEIQRIGGWRTLQMVARYCGDSLTGTRQALETADKLF